MIKLEIENIKKNYFRGYVYREELPDKIQIMFTGKTVEVEGEYYVEWVHGQAIPVISGPLLAYEYKPTVKGKRKMIFANLDKSIVDFSTIEEELMESGLDAQWLGDLD